jgi:hypothetical protein
MDVTGTLVSFRGTLQEHYLGAAKKCGVDISGDNDVGGGSSSSSVEDKDSGSGKERSASASYRFSDAFRLAYKETSRKHPCFGAGEMSAKEWWKLCVLRSFDLAGAQMTEEQQEIVFQRIYSTFGSHAA